MQNISNFIDSKSLTQEGSGLNEILSSDEYKILDQNNEILKPLGLQTQPTEDRGKRARIMLANRNNDNTAPLDDDENVLNLSPDNEVNRSTEETPMGMQ